MAIPTITDDCTILHYFEDQTNLSAWGSNALLKWGNSADIKREGTYSMALAPASTGDTGMGYTHGSNMDLSTNRVFVWINVISTGFINRAAATPAGVYIRICTSSTSWTTDYKDYYIGGNDIAWCGAGWHLVALDCNRTADRSSGITTLSTIRRIGVGFNVTATASKSDVLAVDILRIGTKFEATGVTSSSSTHNFNDNGGSADTITRASGDFTADGFEGGDTIRVSGTTYNDGDYRITAAAALTLTLATGSLAQTETGVTSNIDAAITLEDIYQKDGPTDDLWKGVVSKNRDGDYEINAKLLIGDESGSGRTFFMSSGESIILADQPLSASSAELGIFSTEDTSANTIIEIGQSSGTGDTRVGYDGSAFRQDITYVGTKTDGAALGIVDLSAAADTCSCFGSNFNEINAGVLYSNDADHLVTNCVYSECGQVDLYAVEARNLQFLNYLGGSGTGALLWRDGSTNIKNSNFINNTRAVEHPDAGTTSITYYNLVFSGNTYDIDYSAASGTLTINNLPDSNANTYVISGGGTSVSFNTARSLTITCKNQYGYAIEGIRVRIENASSGVLISEGTTLSTGVYEDTSYNYTGDVDVKVIARLKGYQNNQAYDTISNDGLSVPFTMVTDRAVNLP